MKYTQLGNTEIKVSKICLGTMTYGQQNTIEDAAEQLDYALDQGVNFIDTAEMYPVPAFAHVQGRTEEYIGDWLSKSKKRDQIVLASKIAGPNRNFEEFMRKPLQFNREQFEQALDDSLRRLKTDYIDLYQLHWPERKINMFGQRGVENLNGEEWNDNIQDILEGLQDQIKAGKIKHIGISNETPWGFMKYIQESYNNLPRIVSVQNAYSLLNRQYEVGMSEISLRENIGLLAYSPLAFGLLTGKYHNGSNTQDARLTKYPNFRRYASANTFIAAKGYIELAKEISISPTILALSFVNQRSFVTSNIIGATTMSQLKENIESINFDLSDEILNRINEIHEKYPNPAP